MKKIALLFLISIFLFGCGSSSSNKSDEIPTSFATCDELKNFVQYYSYSDLKKMWGMGSIGEPWDCSGVGEFNMKVKVKWTNVKCNGWSVEIMFTNSHSGVGDAFDKSPNLFDGIFCDEYKTPYVETPSETPTQNENKAEVPIENKEIETTTIEEEKKEVLKTGIVTASVNRAYFYDEPNLQSRRSSYIVEGQSVEYTDRQNDFIKASFTNIKGVTTNGWMLASDFGNGNTEPSDNIEEAEGEIFTIVEQMPSFNGGEAEKEKYLAKNIIYPTKEKEAGISGTCYLKFIVEKDGSLSNVEITRGVRNGEGCDKEAIRVVSNMPKWIAGKQNGNTVRVSVNLPIKFLLK